MNRSSNLLVEVNVSCRWTEDMCKNGVLSRVQLFATPWTVAHQDPVHRIFQARVLEWVAISFSNIQGGRLFLRKYLTHHAPPHCHSLPGSCRAVVICLQPVASTQPPQQGHTSSLPLTDPVEGTQCIWYLLPVLLAQAPVGLSPRRCV